MICRYIFMQISPLNGTMQWDKLNLKCILDCQFGKVYYWVCVRTTMVKYAPTLALYCNLVTLPPALFRVRLTYIFYLIYGQHPHVHRCILLSGNIKQEKQRPLLLNSWNIQVTLWIFKLPRFYSLKSLEAIFPLCSNWFPWSHPVS